MGRPRLDNPETSATLYIQDEDKQSNKKTQKTKKMSNTDPTRKQGLNPGAHKEYGVPDSNKNPIVSE